MTKKSETIAVKVDPELEDLIPGYLKNRRKDVKSILGAVRVEKDPQYTEPGSLLFSVADTGIGIPPEKLETIFAPFTQADSSTSRKYGGTGLGLSICRGLVEMMRGRIWLESKVGQGSTFYFTARFEVPVSTGAGQALQTSEVRGLARPRDERTLNILLVEDSVDNRMLIQMFLKKTRYRIDIAENGAIAVDKFQSGNYDLVLMDMEMPVMDGYDATRTIRRWEKEQSVKATPIVALTAHALTEERQTCLDAGCTAHISKPIKKALLMETILEYAEINIGHQSEVGV